MAQPAPPHAPQPGAGAGAGGHATPVRDHGFHTVRVARVVAETADAVSLVIDPPDELRDRFAYRAGQFCTFRVHIDGRAELRSYSMSSSPDVDDELTVTVKRVPGGLVSNWMNDTLRAGSEVEATLPAGVFCLTADGADVLAAAAGSGITPVISIIKTALATTDRRVRLLYANRDADSTIFAAELATLEQQHPGRLVVQRHHDVDGGFLEHDAVRDFLGEPAAADDLYVCGPTPFMDLVEDAALASGVAAERIHLERFAHPGDAVAPPADVEPAATDAGVTTVTIELEGRTEVTEHHAGTTILQTARQVGMSPPFSCESGSCATCMGRLVEGTVTMHVNDALDDDEVAEGWILTCQSVPTSETVHVIYGYD